MKAREWREKSTGEREKALLELIAEQRKLRFDIATRETKTHRAYRTVKKDIARLKTIATEETR